MRWFSIFIATLLALLVVGGSFFWSLQSGELLTAFSGSVDATVLVIQSWGAWGVLGSISLMAVHSFLPFPAEVIALANGMVYGPLWGTI
ncbi:MAG: hypothetical protein ABI351_00955, partial [Herbaspirillum sp.]